MKGIEAFFLLSVISLALREAMCPVMRTIKHPYAGAHVQ